MDEEEKEDNLMVDGEVGNEDEPLDLPDEPLEDDTSYEDPDDRYH
jgi:hypothetical protein